MKLRYKAPDGDTSRLISTTLRSQPQPLTANLGFASAVAEVGMLLRGSKHAGSAAFGIAVARARSSAATIREGYRAEFIKLAELASSLRGLETSSR